MGLIKAVIAWAKGVFAALRQRVGFVDHLVRAAGRYSTDHGSMLATNITLPGFFSFFPLFALALSIAGFVEVYDHGATRQITNAISGYFPGLIGSKSGQLNPTTFANDKAATGAIGLVGLLVGGLGVVSSMRTSIRLLFHQPQQTGFFLIKKLKDIPVLLGLGLAIIVSLGLTSAASTAANGIVGGLGLPTGGVTQVVLQALAIAVAIGGDTLLFAVLFLRLPEVGGRFREVLSGAVFAAVGFEILKSVGAIYIKHTTSNPLYASFSVVIGLLVWTGLIAQVFVFAGAWAVTRPYASDVAPSGTAADATDPPGVPSLPLAAVEGAARVPVADASAGRRGAVVGTVTLGVLGGVTAAVLRHGWNTARRSLGGGQ